LDRIAEEIVRFCVNLMGVVKVHILDGMRFDAIGRFFKGNWLELLNFIIRDSDLSPVILAGSLFDELDTASLFFT